MKHVLAVLSVAIVAVGCLNERVYMDPNANLSSSSSAPSNLTLNNGRLAGDFGPRRGFDGAATEMTGSSDRDWETSTVTVTRNETTRGTGMMIIWTNGVLIEDMEPGDYSFTLDETAAPMSVNVCSGADGTMDYDQPADQVDLQVTQNPQGGRDFLVTTTTSSMEEDAPDVGTATFTINR